MSVEFVCHCGTVSDQRQCPDHRRRRNRGAAWSGGSTYAWRRLREAVFRRDDGICVHCGRYAPLEGPDAGHADHRVAKALGGPDELMNLQWSCSNCNLARSNDAKTGVRPAPSTSGRRTSVPPFLG